MGKFTRILSWCWTCSNLAWHVFNFEVKPMIYAYYFLSTKQLTDIACTKFSKINFYLLVLKIFKAWFWWICPPPANRMEEYLFFCNPEAFYKTCMALQYPPCTWNLRNTAQLVQFIFKYPKGFQTPKCRHILLTYIFVGLGSWVVYIWMHLTYRCTK